ncbi:hypothetical protein LJC56_07615 [Christensenellaceae bacterium OttesenSCG-928-K19]|nr:hypothetical protein [Christensenellaceae bacterium OttesenSCG-928-K19]
MGILSQLFSRQISEKDLAKVKSLLKESAEYAQAANAAVKPEVFFEKYDLLEARLTELIKYEKYKIFKGNLPSRDLTRIQEQRQNEVNAMIQRGYHNAKEKAGRSPEKGAEIMADFFNHLELFKDKMNKFNRKVVDDLRVIALEQA